MAVSRTEYTPGSKSAIKNLSLFIGGAVKIMRSVLDLGDTEMYIFRRLPSALVLMICNDGLMVLVNTNCASSLGSSWMMRWAWSMI